MAVKVFSLCFLAVALFGSFSCTAGQGQSGHYFMPMPPESLQKPQDPQNVQPPRYPRPQMPKPPSPPQIPQQPSKPKVPPSPEVSTCEVASHFRIQCGLPDISESDCRSINCCYDGQKCYYGRALTLQCTKDGQFIVVIARDATLPNIDLNSVYFRGPGQKCSPVDTSPAFAVYQFAVTDCGTSVTETEGSVITYENRMSSSYEVAVGPVGAITRDSQFDVLLQCRYIGAHVFALVTEVGSLHPLPTVAAPGPLRVELRLGNGQCTAKGCAEEDVAYNSFYMEGDYPVTKVLRDPVYVEVRMLGRTDPNLVLTLGRCWATSSTNPYSFPQWDLLVNGCPYVDDRYRTTLVPVDGSSGLSFPTHHKRFIFKMFTFVARTGMDDGMLTPLQEMVYIHCNTAVCRPSYQDNCEPRCFRRRRDVAGKSDFEPESAIVTSPAIIFVQSSEKM